MTPVDILILTGKILFIVIMALNITGALTWAERKQSAVIQDRLGANRADIFGIRILGLFHPIADAIKMFTKEDFTPAGAHKVLFNLGPFIPLFCGILCFAVIPFGDRLFLFGREIKLQVMDINIGILFFLCAVSMSVYGVVLGGWASNNKWALMGSVRSAAQMISYEVIMGLSLLGALLVFGTLRLDDISAMQGASDLMLFGVIPRWGILLQPLGCLLFMIASMAETERVPFDMPEGESEILGFDVEYSGMKFGMFMMSGFLKTVIAASLLTVLYFGGYHIPYLYLTHGAERFSGIMFPGGAQIMLPVLLVSLLQIGAFFTKVIFFCVFLLLVRWTLPRFRYDQLMHLCWKIMLPLSLANIFITSLLILSL